MRRGAQVAPAFVAALALLAVACNGGDQAASPTTVPAETTTTTAAVVPSTTTTGLPATTAPPAAPVPAADQVTLHAAGVRLGEAGDGFRVVVHSDAADVTVTVRGRSSPLRVCPVRGLDGPASGPACVTPAVGVATRLPLAPAYRGVDVARTGTGEATTLDEVAIAYRPRDRGMEIRLPTMAPGAPAAGTVFRLAPPAPGSLHATATWSGVGGQVPSRGELTVEEGPAPNGRLVAKAEGAPGGRVTATQNSPVGLWLTMRASGDAPLVAPTITVTWPG